MTRYERGVRIERVVRKRLESEGYIVVRSAGSKGAFDLVAIHTRTGKTKCVQVKATRTRNAHAIAKREYERLRHAYPALHRKGMLCVCVWTSAERTFVTMGACFA